jgi:glycosyltransferase involved in cell wall biosynthesis
MVNSSIKRIAILHPLMGFIGGAENLITWCAEEMALRGIEVTVYAKTIPNEQPKNFRIVQVDMDMRLWKWPRVAKELLRELKTYDRLIFHNFPSAIYVYLAQKEAKKNNLKLPPSLFYCHEPCRPWYGKNEAEYMATQKRYRWKLDFAALNNIRLDKKAVRGSDHLIGNSKRTSRFASWIYGKSFSTIYPGLPPSYIKASPEKNNENQNPDRFIFLSRLHWIKNLIGAIKAYHLFLQDNPSSLADLYVIGEGSDETPGRQLARELGIDARIHFMGFLSNEEIDKQMSKAYAILNVAMEEPFGLVTLETWARKTPLILSREAGSSEICEDEKNVLLVDPAEPATIARAMTKLANDHALRTTLVENGFATLTKNFLVEHHVSQLLDVMGSDQKSI